MDELGLQVNQDRLWRRLEALARHGATAGGGVTRLGLSAEDRAAADEVGRWLSPLGFEHSLDSAGNNFWKYPGPEDAPAVMVGSHLDSVPQGGRFDGAAGVVAAAEVAQVLAESGRKLQRPVEVVAFANEEGVRFAGGLMGSQAVAGRFSDDSLLGAVDSGGVSLKDALSAYGVQEPSLVAARRPGGSLAAYFELHVEQGGVLEAAGVPVGLVEGVTGLYQARFELTGHSGHAGAAPMEGRRDPLVAAARVVQRVEEVARSHSGAVRGTVGWIEAHPGAENVIPSHVRFSVDVRSVDRAAWRAAITEVFAEVEAVSEERGLDWRVLAEQDTEPVVLDGRLRLGLEEFATASGLPHLTLPSGGGHDAMIMQGVCPTALLFVRSENGLSHHPDEYSSPEDLAAGAQLLLRGVAKAAGA